MYVVSVTLLLCLLIIELWCNDYRSNLAKANVKGLNSEIELCNVINIIRYLWDKIILLKIISVRWRSCACNKLICIILKKYGDRINVWNPLSNIASFYSLLEKFLPSIWLLKIHWHWLKYSWETTMTWPEFKDSTFFNPFQILNANIQLKLVYSIELFILLLSVLLHICTPWVFIISLEK